MASHLNSAFDYYVMELRKRMFIRQQNVSYENAYREAEKHWEELTPEQKAPYEKLSENSNTYKIDPEIISNNDGQNSDSSILVHCGSESSGSLFGDIESDLPDWHNTPSPCSSKPLKLDRSDLVTPETQINDGKELSFLKYKVKKIKNTTVKNNLTVGSSHELQRTLKSIAERSKINNGSLNCETFSGDDESVSRTFSSTRFAQISRSKKRLEMKRLKESVESLGKNVEYIKESLQKNAPIRFRGSCDIQTDQNSNLILSDIIISKNIPQIPGEQLDCNFNEKNQCQEDVSRGHLILNQIESDKNQINIEENSTDSEEIDALKDMVKLLNVQIERTEKSRIIGHKFDSNDSDGIKTDSVNPDFLKTENSMKSDSIGDDLFENDSTKNDLTDNSSIKSVSIKSEKINKYLVKNDSIKKYMMRNNIIKNLIKIEPVKSDPTKNYLLVKNNTIKSNLVRKDPLNNDSEDIKNNLQSRNLVTLRRPKLNMENIKPVSSENVEAAPLPDQADKNKNVPLQRMKLKTELQKSSILQNVTLLSNRAHKTKNDHLCHKIDTVLSFLEANEDTNEAAPFVTPALDAHKDGESHELVVENWRDRPVSNGRDVEMDQLFSLHPLLQYKISNDSLKSSENEKEMLKLHDNPILVYKNIEIDHPSPDGSESNRSQDFGNILQDKETPILQGAANSNPLANELMKPKFSKNSAIPVPSHNRYNKWPRGVYCMDRLPINMAQERLKNIRKCNNETAVQMK